MSFSIRNNPNTFSPRSGKCDGSRGFFPAAARAAVCIAPLMAEQRGSNLQGNGLPDGILGRIGVSVSGADSNRIYAIIEAKEGGIFRSEDGGTNWTKINDDGRFRQRAWYFSKIYADPKSPDTVYVLNTGAFKSVDGGKTFSLLPARHGDHHGFWIDPKNPDRLANANDGGASASNRRRQDMDDARESADRAVLSRLSGQRVSVSHLRCATG